MHPVVVLEPEVIDLRTDPGVRRRALETPLLRRKNAGGRSGADQHAHAAWRRDQRGHCDQCSD
jgi:hypothetical protein